MLLEDYLHFLSPDDIRIKGHRIGIQDAIKYYLSGYRRNFRRATKPKPIKNLCRNYLLLN